MGYILHYGHTECASIIKNIPDRTATHYVVSPSGYYSIDFQSYYDNNLKEWYDSDYCNEIELLEAYGQVINLADLRHELYGL